MAACFCREKHGVHAGLCAECRELLDYAAMRLERCPFGGDKPVCSKCPVHCYQAARREQVRAVMRHAGPRLLWKHPVLALLHFWDARREAPPLRSGGGGAPDGTRKSSVAAKDAG